LDFISKNLFTKLFRPGITDIAKDYRSYFDIGIPSCLIRNKPNKFLSRYNCAENRFCEYCSQFVIFI